MRILLYLLCLLCIFATNASANGFGNRTPSFEVTITNITPGETFTPILAAAHRRNINLFTVGEPASEELSILAESGEIAPLNETLLSLPNLVSNTSTTAGMLGPGESATMIIETQRRFNQLSVAAMLIPTNDTFFALDSARLPIWGNREVVYYVPAFDAGSEPNDQLCENIPGPPCFGEGVSEDVDGEGFVHISSGIHSNVGDLTESVYDWRNPVARITIRRLSR